MRIVCDTQRTQEWFAARCGKVTASEISAVLSKYKAKGREKEDTSERYNYKLRLIGERLTGRCEDQYVSRYMEFGADYEDFARAAYETTKGTDVDQTGFVLHPTIDLAGCSPDGLIGHNGLLEIKVPQTKTHLDYKHAGVVPPEYIPQIQWQMACCDRQWCDFVSYNPYMPQDLKLFVATCFRDDELIFAMQAGVVQFLAEVEEFIAELRSVEDPLTITAAEVAV